MVPTCEYHDNFAIARGHAADKLSRAAQPCLFDRLSWYDALSGSAFGDKSPVILTARQELAAVWLMLVAAGPGRLISLANYYSFSWAPAFALARTEVTRLALLRAAARAVASRAWRLTLSPVADEDGSVSLICTAFEQEGWLARAEPCDENHIVTLNGRSFDQYWQDRPGQLRSTVRRKGAKNVVAVRIDRRFTEEAWRDYESVYARSWKPEEGSPAFLRTLAEEEGAAGTLRLGLAYIDGHPVAAQFWTVENGCALIHKLAHDEAHVKASPGTLLTAALFQHVIDTDRVALVDFGTGNDPYKRDWMEDVRLRYKIDLFRPAHPMSWPNLARNWLKDAYAARANRLAATRPND